MTEAIDIIASGSGETEGGAPGGIPVVPSQVSYSCAVPPIQQHCEAVAAIVSAAQVPADAPVVRGDSQALRTTSGLTREPMVRVPLSVFQKGSAELAELPALRARVAELEAELVEMPDLRVECESLGDELHALRAVLGPESLPAHFEHNPFTELTERARLLVEQVYGCDPRGRNERQRAHDDARVEHIRTLERALRVQVRDNRQQRQTLLLAADVLDDVITATAIGMAIPKPRIEKVAKAARLWTRAGGPCRVVADRAVVERAVRRLVRWFGRTPGRASSELAWRSGSHLVAAVHAEFETAEALKATKTTTKKPDAPVAAVDAAQVDIEEVIAKAATPTKPKRARAKKSTAVSPNA